MEKTVIDKLGLEASPLERIRHFEKALEEVKARPKPSGESFQAWEEREKKKCEEEMATMADSLCLTSYREVEATYSAERWVDVLLRKFGAEPVKLSTPVIRLAYLPLFRKFLEAHSEKMMLGRFEEDVKQVEREIGKWRAKSPKPFDPARVNIDERFPILRVGFQNEKPYDRWLTESLKSKAPIFFLPHSEWLKNLLRFWDEVYGPAEAEKARKASIQVPVEKVEEKKPEPQKPGRGDAVNPLSEIARIDREREVEEVARAEMDREALFSRRHGIYGRGR